MPNLEATPNPGACPAAAKWKVSRPEFGPYFPPPLPGQMLGILELQHGTFRKLEGTYFGVLFHKGPAI